MWKEVEEEGKMDMRREKVIEEIWKRIREGMDGIEKVIEVLIGDG